MQWRAARAEPSGHCTCSGGRFPPTWVPLEARKDLVDNSRGGEGGGLRGACAFPYRIFLVGQRHADSARSVVVS